MSAPASSDLRELETELVNRAEQGATMEVAEIREMFGVGHDDAIAMLDVLRENGKAVEDAPGLWRGPSQEEAEWLARASEPSPAPVRVSVPESSPNGAPRRGPERSQLESVRLTRAMVEALDDEALGKLVRAGVEGSDGAFALEVE